jgi:hypothetical protein
VVADVIVGSYEAQGKIIDLLETGAVIVEYGEMILTAVPFTTSTTTVTTTTTTNRTTAQSTTTKP